MQKTNNKAKAKDKLVLALDIDTKEEALKLIKDLKDYVGVFKVGLQLFTGVGPEIVKIMHSEGVKIFFDCKFNDIPNTVATASANIVKLGAVFFNIHMSGGSQMVKSTVKLAQETAQKYNLPTPIILGVTVLSSIDQTILSNELGIKTNIDDYVVELAQKAKAWGLSGVVASVKEASKIRAVCGENFVILCPGIRPKWSDSNDQQRIATPASAIDAGADFIVVGRPITAASNKLEATKMILSEMEQALEKRNQ